MFGEEALTCCRRVVVVMLDGDAVNLVHMRAYSLKLGEFDTLTALHADARTIADRSEGNESFINLGLQDLSSVTDRKGVLRR